MSDVAKTRKFLLMLVWFGWPRIVEIKRVSRCWFVVSGKRVERIQNV
jgi:hypothetical protein